MFLALGGEQKVGVERLSYLSAYGFALADTFDLHPVLQRSLSSPECSQPYIFEEEKGAFEIFLRVIELKG